MFLNQETGTHIVLHRQEKVSGHRIVFGPDTFDACIGWVNAKDGVRPRQNHSVFRNHTTGTLLVLGADTTSRNLSPVYGPETFDNCLEWAKLNSSSPESGHTKNGGENQ